MKSSKKWPTGCNVIQDGWPDVMPSNMAVRMWRQRIKNFQGGNQSYPFHITHDNGTLNTIYLFLCVIASLFVEDIVVTFLKVYLEAE